MSDFSISLSNFSNTKNFFNNSQNEFKSDISNIATSINNNFKNVQEKVDQLIIQTKEFGSDVKENIEEKVNWVKTTGLATVTDFVAHTGRGALDSLEDMIDGTAMTVVGDIAITAYKILDKLDIEEVTLNGEKIEIGDASKTVSQLEKSLENFVKRDLTQEAWDAGAGQCEWIKEYSTCSTNTREIAEGLGSAGTYIGLSMVPYAGPVLMGLGAGGSAAENAYNNGATYEQASAVFNVAAIAGLVTDGLLDKIGAAAKGAKTMKGAMKAIGFSGLTAEIEPLVNGLAQYLAYGKNQKDENGNYLYKNGISGLNQFFSDNGFYMQMAMAGGAGIVRGFMSRLKVKTETNNKAVEQIMESDINTNGTNYKFNSDLMNNSDSISIPEQRIKDLEKAFKLDYYNDAHDKKIIDAIYSVILNDDIPDENVAKIVKNIEGISGYDSKFKFFEGSGASAFSQFDIGVIMESDLLERSTEVVSQTELHEMGHAFLHIFKGDNYVFNLSDELKNIVVNAKNNLEVNPDKYLKYLKKSAEMCSKATDETVAWYDKIRPQENARISDMIDELFESGDLKKIKDVITDALNMPLAKNLLNEANVSFDDLDDILHDKNLIKEILTKQNNINNQQMHYDELMGSYSEYGDYRKISAVINSITQKVEHVVSETGEKISCRFSHSDEYWSRLSVEDSFRSTFDELCADYFSLASHGRTEVIAMMDDILGPDLMGAIRNQFATIADTMTELNLIKY